MKIFDVHSDLLYDLYQNKKKGIKNRFNDVHVSQIQQSMIQGAIWTMYSPEDFDLKEAVQMALSEIDISKLSKFEYLLGFEGLRNLIKPEDLDYFVELGFSHAMLTWNEENKYATGVGGDKNRGLTDLGKELLNRMMEHDMIIDLAHLNEKSFYEVLEYSNKNIIYSHGNIKSLCDHRRNLSLDQMKALKEKNGLFGLTLAKNFVSNNPNEKNLERFLDHVELAMDIMGEDLVCFGFDFMDYLGDEFPSANIDGVEDATQAYKIVEGMRLRGFSSEVISKVCYDNFYQRFGHKAKKKEITNE